MSKSKFVNKYTEILKMLLTIKQKIFNWIQYLLIRTITICNCTSVEIQIKVLLSN